MEGKLRKRIFSLSWMIATLMVWSVIGAGTSVLAADGTVTDSRLYGQDYGREQGVYGKYGHSAAEDLLTFTSTNYTIGAAGEQTNFVWKSAFGKRYTGDSVTVRIVDGTNVFDNQGIYFGARSNSNGVGGDAIVTFDGGTNTFTHRVIFGGEGGYDGATTSLAGQSVVTFNGGVNTFEFDPKFTTSYYSGGKFLGNKEVGSYDDVDEYTYYLNYYGVYFSAMTAIDDIAPGGEDGGNTKGAILTFNGGANTFNMLTSVGGSYDLTPRCSISRSSDDNDITFGGTNEVYFNGGINSFGARTYFGGAGSTTTVEFNGGMTTFTGTVPSYNSDNALAYTEDWSNNRYRGDDLPYVFFGGKDLTEGDIEDFNDYYGITAEWSGLVGTSTMESSTEVVIGKDGTLNPNMTTVDLQTTAFFGGADDRWLAGDQVYVSGDGTLTDGEIESLFVTRSSTDGSTDYSSLRNDTGSASLKLVSGKLRLGYANTTELVGERADNGEDEIDHWDKFVVTDTRSRYEQVRLIGTNASFEATGGRILFDTRLQVDALGELGAVANQGMNNQDFNNDYLGYFNTIDATTTTPDGETAYILQAGMFAFDSISISSNVDITVDRIGYYMMRAEENADMHNLYTTTVFVDTTGASDYITATDGTEVMIDLDAHSEANGALNSVQKTVYEKWAYTLTVEDVDPVYAETPGLETNEARLHIVTKDIDDILVGNMKDNADTVKYMVGQDNPDAAPCAAVTDALEQIFSTSVSAEDAAGNFDQLIGATYGAMVSNRVRQTTMFNSLLANQVMASDVCIRNIRKARLNDWNSGGDCGSCGDCCECCRKWTGWASFYGNNGETDMHHYYSGYDTDTWGAAIALDWNDCESRHFGVFFNYGESNIDSSASMGYTHIESQDYMVGLYGKWLGVVGGGYGLGVVSVAWSDYEMKRELYLDDTFDGDTKGVSPSLYYERGWMWFCKPDAWINPYFALQYVYAHTDGFSENGYDIVGNDSDLSLTVSDIDHHSLRTFVGLRASRDFMFGRCCDRRITLRANAAWIHDLLGSVDPTFTTHHACNPTYPVWNVRGNNGGRDWANIGMGVDFNLCERLSLLADYNVYVNQYDVYHGGMATLRFEF
ncbi:MAG: autotransporter outer membrane beta-barrel domain-containing protein [Planctomycetia bacterium]|nr:autotransporter outer membrane beta-barrel domain-containing protein [Planctomycetia bacterium]